MKRRDVLGAMGAMFGLTLIPFGVEPAIAGVRSKKFVFVILRGGMDGLAAVPAIGDPTYAAARDRVALDPSKVLELDSTFGLHPAFKDMHPLFKGGELSFVHAVAFVFVEKNVSLLLVHG